MARAWVDDQWVKDATVTLPDGSTTRVSPTPAQLRSLKTLPEHFRTERFGKGSRWLVRWYEPKLDGGRAQRKQSFKKKTDADAFAAGLEDDIRAGRYIDPAAQEKTFQKAADEWLTSKARIKDSTWRRYRRELDNYVIPKWGTKAIGSITRPQIDEWVQELKTGTAPYVFDTRGHLKKVTRTARPLKASYISHMVGATFGGVLRYAVNEQWIGRNPLRHVELPRDESDIDQDLPHLTYEEIERAATEAKRITGRLSDLVLTQLLAYSGPRIGEATGLKVKDLDLDGKRARIMRTWTVDKQGNRKLGPAKTWQKRWIPLSSFVVDGLRVLVKDRAGNDRDGEEYVFTNSRGGSVDGKNWYNRVWVKARATAGLPNHISVHDLRHVAASLAITAGGDVKLVQQMLGHKDATETLNTYSHLWPDRVDEVVSLVESRRADALGLVA